MNKPLFALGLLLLAPAAQAQLWSTPQATAAQPTLSDFRAVTPTLLQRGDARIELDKVGQWVVGVYATAPKNDTDSVARAIAAAWGAGADALPQLKTLLDTPGFQQEVSAKVFREVSQDGQSEVNVRLSGGKWQVYTALKVYPASAFPVARTPAGNEAAPARVNIVSDYQCPYCQRLWVSPALLEWRAKPAIYQVHYNHFPLPMHPAAVPAAEAAECAADQGRGAFWNFSDQVYANFEGWGRLDAAQASALFPGYAERAGLDVGKFSACLKAGTHRAAVLEEAQTLQKNLMVSGTPSVYVGGIKLTNYMDEAQVRAVRAVTEVTPSAASVIGQRLKLLR